MRHRGRGPRGARSLSMDAAQAALGPRLGNNILEGDSNVMRVAAGGMNNNGHNFLGGGGIPPTEGEPYHL